MLSQNELLRFVTNEKYLQNPPLETNAFVAYLEKLGFSHPEERLLESVTKGEIQPIFQRDNSTSNEKWIRFKNQMGEFTRPSHYGLLKDEELLEEFEQETEINYVSFGEWDKDGLLYELNKSILFPFKELNDEKYLNYYSNFQALLLDLQHRNNYLVNKVNYPNFIKFLVFIQSGFYPYFFSSGKTIRISGTNLSKWQEALNSIDISYELNYSNLSLDELLIWYKLLSQNAINILGAKNSEWLQLWKNISWDKKQKLEGSNRLGIEYLQLAIMLKSVIERKAGKKILDIDEISNISGEDILYFEVEKMNQSGQLLRATRNQIYSDGKINYYDNHYKRLYYLSNEFGISFHPRIMLFIEGLTEKESITYIIEQLWGNPESHGIELFSFDGISGLYGKGLDLNHEGVKKYSSNFFNLVSYNLEKWQILPYIISDNENKISDILLAQPISNNRTIKFMNNSYAFPRDWLTIWGVDYTNIGYKGDSFELVNFSNKELVEVLPNFIKGTIKENEIQNLRNQNLGLKSLDNKINGAMKIEISKNLFENLFENYKKSQNENYFNRPIFKTLNVVMRLATLNHQPTNTIAELKNKQYLLNLLGKPV